MNINEYTEAVAEELYVITGQEFVVADVLKNNVTLHGIHHRTEEGIAPTVYLDSFFEAGIDAKESAARVIEIIKGSSLGITADELNEILSSWETAKGLVSARAVSVSGNEEFLAGKVYDVHLGLARYYGILLEGMDGSGWISISPEFMERWGISRDALAAQAEENDLAHVSIRTMGDVLLEMIRKDSDSYNIAEMAETGVFCDDFFWVVSKDSGHYGAALFLIKEVRDRICEKIGGGFFILPSSVHEFLCVPEGRMGYDELKQMVASVNETEVSPEDLLSYDVYEVDKDGDLLPLREQ